MRDLGSMKKSYNLFVQMSTALKTYNGVAVFILGGKTGKYFFVTCDFNFSTKQNSIYYGSGFLFHWHSVNSQ